MVGPMFRMCVTAARPTLRVQRNNAAIQHTSLLRMALAKPPVASMLVQRRTFASTSPSSDQNETSQTQLVYEGPMSRAVRLMKGVSVTSCVLTTFGMPVLCYMSEQSASAIGKWAMCGTIMLFGFGTTSLYHALFEPYVLRMWINAPHSPLSDATVVTAESLTLLAQRKTTQFTLGDVARPVSSIHPMVSFRAKDKNYFLHPEVIQDEELIKKFMGEDFKVIKKDATKDQDDDEEYY